MIHRSFLGFVLAKDQGMTGLVAPMLANLAPGPRGQIRSRLPAYRIDYILYVQEVVTHFI